MRRSNGLTLALIHSHYRPDGGAEKAIIHTLNALGLKGAHVKVISRNWYEGHKNAQVVPCNPFYAGRLWREWGFAIAAKRILNTLQIDIVQSQIRLSGCDIYRAGGGVHREWLKQRKRISGPLKRLFVECSLYNAYKLHAEKQMYLDPRLKAVICNSRMVRDEIEHYFKVPRENLHIIYNAVDHEKFDRQNSCQHRHILRDKLGLQESRVVYLFVGSGFERKGLSILLDCIAHLPKDSALIVVGKESHAKKYYSKCRQLGIAERVIFTGMQKDIALYYAAADVFVLPTLYDAFANSVLEAMAASLPVITSLKCGAVDIIENERNGFICDALDKERIIRYMRRLRDPEIRKAVGSAGRETVSTFTIERMSRQLYALYEKIMVH